jgi:hypothetical protein
MKFPTRSMALACVALLGALAAQAQDAATGGQALRQLYDQRDAKRVVEVKIAPKMHIGKDALEFTVRSSTPGFVYILWADSGNKTLQVLFPNKLDSNNRIAPGQDLKLPRPAWGPLRSAGPPGTDSLLVLVADGPRNLSSLSLEGPFITAANDAAGREKLGTQITTSSAAASAMCQPGSPTRNNSLCSHAYGAGLVTVEEVR